MVRACWIYCKYRSWSKVDRAVRFEYYFISDVMPDQNAVFLIRGERYLCESLTANFTEHGMSQKIKGVFWKIIG